MYMATKSLGVTKEMNEMRKQLIKTGIYKSQSEAVTDAIRQLTYKYTTRNAPSLNKVRQIIERASRKSGKTLSQTLREIRDEK